MNLIESQIIYVLNIEENFTINLWKNNILINSTHNESKSVITERFIETLKAKLYKRNNS